MTLDRTFQLARIDSAALREIYTIVDQIRSEDISTANRHTKAGLTRMRGLLSTLSKRCKTAREELLEMRNGQIRHTRGQRAKKGGEQSHGQLSKMS